MEILGVVDEITAEGRAVVRARDVPDIGTPVFDQKERKIGIVKRIFGPVDEPYVSISVDAAANPSGLKDKTLYYTKGSQNGKGKRRNRRD